MVMMQSFGIRIDDAKNEAATGGKTAEISAADSRIKILVIPTDEELSIAQQVWIDGIAAHCFDVIFKHHRYKRPLTYRLIPFSQTLEVVRNQRAEE